MIAEVKADLVCTQNQQFSLRPPCVSENLGLHNVENTLI